MSGSRHDSGDREAWRFAPSDAAAALRSRGGQAPEAAAGRLAGWLGEGVGGRRILRVLARAERFFLLALPGLRDMYLAGGLVPAGPGRGESATGCGPTPGAALARLAGEIAEARARARLPSRLGSRAGCGDWAAGAARAAGLPARSEGMAAAPSLAEARLAGLLELVERDAAAHWWLGGRRARQPAQAAARRFAALVARHWPGWGTEGLRLLDLTRLPGFPVMAALAWGRTDGGLALGIACRLGVADAVEAAHRELCQMRFGLELARRRAARGAARLGPADRRALARAEISPACPLLRPAAAASPGGAPLPACPRQAAGALAARGIAVSALDLSSPEDPLKACKAIAPELQPYATGITTAALRETIAKSGGGGRYVGEIPLY